MPSWFDCPTWDHLCVDRDTPISGRIKESGLTPISFRSEPPTSDYINTPICTGFEFEPPKEDRIYTFDKAFGLVIGSIEGFCEPVREALHTSRWCLFQGDDYSVTFIFSDHWWSSARACELMKYDYDIGKMKYHTDLVRKLMGDSYDTRTQIYEKYLSRFIPPNRMHTSQDIYFVPNNDGRFDVVCRPKNDCKDNSTYRL